METPSVERLHRHIKVFEDKIVTAQHTFSPRTFHEMMKLLKLVNPAIGRVTSLLKLKDIIQHEYIKAQHITENTESSTERQARVRERRVRVYFKWFLDFFDYLKAMKHNFDTKIHKWLLQMFYDKLKDSPYGIPGTPPSPGVGQSRGTDSNILSVGLTDFSTLSGSLAHTDMFLQKTVKSIQNEYKEITHIYENKDLDELADRLLRQSRKLEQLLREDNDLDVILSKIPKPHDGKKDIGDDVFNFIHLMNCIFVKFKSIGDLSKAWLQTDTRRMHILQEKISSLKDIQKSVSRKKMDLGFAIKKHQLDLERESNGLNSLLKREERVNDLSSMLFDTEQSIISLRGDLQKSREERDVIAQELLAVPATNKERFAELKSRYQKNRISRFVLFKTIQAMEYNKNLVEQDSLLETELRPSIIISTNDAQERCERLEATVEEERNQRKMLENILAPLQKDRQTIESELLRQIMLDTDRRNSAKNFVWGAGGSGSSSGGHHDSRGRLATVSSSSLSLPDPDHENERLGSGRLSLLNPKYSISEVEEELSALRRTHTSTDIRSRYAVLRNIESDPGLSTSASVDRPLNVGKPGSKEFGSMSPDSQRTDVSEQADAMVTTRWY